MNLPRLARTNTLAAFLSLLPGCLLTPLDDIVCTRDSECPDDAFCDLPNDSCVHVDNAVSAPHITVETLHLPDGEDGLYVRVPRNTQVDIELVLKNAGGYDATDVNIGFSQVHDVTLALADDTIARIAPNKSQTLSLSVLATDDAPSPLPVDWFATFSGRERRGVFTLDFAQSETD